jgi:hypothetical protein
MQREIFYDPSGSDNGKVFVELFGRAGTDLLGFAIEVVNGDGGGIHARDELSGLVGASGYFVIADLRSDGTTDLMDFDLGLEFDPQNGPDGVRLVRGEELIDAVGYGKFGIDQVFPGEGSPAVDAGSGSSLARRFSNIDTDDNAFDLAVATLSPGRGNAVVPEPAAALLIGMGLCGVACQQRRRSRRELCRSGPRPSLPLPSVGR